MCSREGFEEVVRKSSSGWHGGGKGGRCEEGWCRAPSQTVPSAGRVSGGSWYPRSWLIGEDPEASETKKGRRRNQISEFRVGGASKSALAKLTMLETHGTRGCRL